MDRFSSPMSREFSRPSLDMIDEQNELNKRDIVGEYVRNYAEDNGMFPDSIEVQEVFYPIDLDIDLIEKEIQSNRGIMPWA